MREWKEYVCMIEAEVIKEPNDQILDAKMSKTGLEKNQHVTKCLSNQVVKTVVTETSKVQVMRNTTVFLLSLLGLLGS